MRGKRATKADVWTDHDSKDLRRLLQKVGLEELIQRAKEENAQPPPEADNAFLPGLAFMEENFWKHQRSPKAKRILKQHHTHVFTREEILRLTIRALWADRKELGLGQSESAVVRRLIRKLREGTSKVRN
jgi:hypothetical protein